MDDQSTQLADTRPKLDKPLRVALPVNAPERLPNVPKDEFVYNNAFSPNALAQSKKHHVAITNSARPLEPLTSDWKPVNLSGNQLVNMDHDALVKTAIKDFSVLAFSSKRAGKKDVEATAYASLGVMFDNQGHYLEAIENYKAYMVICEDIEDAIGKASACNCIGVNYMMLANPPSDAGTLNGVRLTDQNKDYLEKAVQFHTKHLEIGPDSGGRFVSNTNLGLCLGMLGSINQAAKHHQDALRIAIKMQTLYGQSIAVGNLGMLASKKRDFSTARTCFDQHLQLVQALQDPEAEITAWKLIAQLCTSQDQHEDALDCLEQARSIAEKESALNELRRINCLIGVARGTVEFLKITADSLSGANSPAVRNT